ncbi:MAG: hypothetical protein BGN85_09455 [Alphaproteobacteria bacterium 64-11]|jgi:hypothetical protein|nr:MAG: hypothetical protein BGN85_09455 [Alphaproteobacteria bacterium 64-11]
MHNVRNRLSRLERRAGAGEQLVIFVTSARGNLDRALCDNGHDPEKVCANPNCIVFHTIYE